MRFHRLSFDQRKADLDAELEFHRRMAVTDRMARGESEADARAAVERELGNVALAKDVTRGLWGWLFIERLGQDLHYALRQMRRSPGFAATVIGTLALGIAATAAMFTVVDHVLLEPVHYRDASRIVTLSETNRARENEYNVPWLDLRQWMEQSRSFSAMAFNSGWGNGRSYLEGAGSSLNINATQVSSNFFDVLGVSPQLGRTFTPEKPAYGANGNAGQIVLSYAVWKQFFGSDRNVLGRTVQVNNTTFTVIGVMPAGFKFPATAPFDAQVWMPVQLGDKDKGRDWQSERYDVLARLRPGVSLASASAEMQTIQNRVITNYTDADDRVSYGIVGVQRYGDSLVNADLRKALVALLTAAGVLWLIAAVNVTNLLLARATARQREIAMRGALGASRGRVIQQMLVEGLLFSGCAAILGTSLALASVKLLTHELALRLPIAVPPVPNAAILLGLIALTLASALFSSAWPALIAARLPIEPALRQGGLQAGTGRRHHRMRGALVSIEIAMSLTLLVSCGLLLRTIWSLRHVALGYRTDHIVVAHLTIPQFRFGNGNMMQTLYNPLLDRARRLPGVQNAGLISEVPLARTFNIQLSLRTDNNSDIASSLKVASPTMQQIFGFKMLAGRFFDSDDTPSSQPVVIVNPAFAKLYAPNKHDLSSIIGMELWHLRDNQPGHIVGVLDNERQMTVALPSQPEVEICICQIAPDVSMYRISTMAMDLAVRTERPAAQFTPELRDVLRQASPELAGATISTMDDIVEDSFGSQRLAAHLLEIFGCSALLLCVAGLYGLLAYIVTQRTREMGVRIALGAPRGNLLWLVLRQAGIMLVVGVAAGSALAWASSRMLRGFLFGVQAHDGWTLIGSAILLFLSGMLAAYLPARRASRVDPMEALRAE
jgi:predicted permease